MPGPIVFLFVIICIPLTFGDFNQRTKNDTFQECMETNKKQQSEIHDLRKRLERLEESFNGNMDPHKRMLGKFLVTNIIIIMVISWPSPTMFTTDPLYFRGRSVINLITNLLHRGPLFFTYFA